MSPLLENFPGNRDRSRRGAVAREGFTLIEMIAVVAIIALAAAAIVPAVTSVAKTSNRRAAVTLTLGMLDQARGLALASSNNYYLALATAGPTWPEEYRCRAFAIFEEKFDAKSGRYNWLPAGEWTKLPTGICFEPAVDTVYATAGDPKDPDEPEFYCHPLGGNRPAVYFKFNGVGGVEAPSDPSKAKVRIFEGYLEANGNLVRTNKSSQETVKVSLATGRARIDDGRASL